VRSPQDPGRYPAPAGATIPDPDLLGPPAQGPELLVHEGERVLRYPIARGAITIGRDPTCDVVLASRFVSGRHARVEMDGAGFRLVDLGSTNGLLRAGKKLAPGTVMPLADGDVLRIGDPATGNFVTLAFKNPQ
jgi:pSer/pThr/pTyr-binding forkhead associated (FHA) protein